MKKKNNYKSKFFSSRKRVWGFTLIELLVSIMIGSIVISGILMFVVQLSETDRRELALTQTQQDMSFGLDYISSELKEAIYVYESECLGTAVNGTVRDGNYCPGLSNYLTFPNGVEPILAFWKIEPLPYTTESTQQLPQTCTSFPESATPPALNQQECRVILLTRNTYTLVVYGIVNSQNNSQNSVWLGPTRITRYELRQFQATPSSPLNTLRQTTGYVEPTNQNVTFRSWPAALDTRTNTATSRQATRANLTTPGVEQVLVDLVDDQNESVPPCPEPVNPAPTLSTYSLSKPANMSSFYACIRRAQSGQTQDVLISIRGNAVKRAGMPPEGRNRTYLPEVTAQVQTRGVFGRKPQE